MALSFSEVYIPFAQPTQAQVPEAQPKPLGLDYSTLKRLDPPFVVTPGGYKLTQRVQDALTNCVLMYLSIKGKDKCFRCCNTGIVKWVANGATAKVCQCVREGAAVLLASEATADTFEEHA
jgi:hypothetical protein